METTIRKVLPLLLRPFESLSQAEKTTIMDAYKALGRDGFEADLRKEKQTRCYASLVLSQLQEDTDYWQEVHQKYIQRNISILRMVERCCQDFYNAGGKTLSVYENYGAVLSSGISIGCFASGDVDFTVSEDEIQLAKKVFYENGFLLHERNDHASVSEKLVLPFFNRHALDGKGYWFNIMRKPVARNFMLNQAKTLNRLHELQEGKLEKYGNTEIRLLPPTAMIYFNALHFASEHYFSASPGMALCCDIDRIVRYRTIDWADLKKWSYEDQCGLRIQLALDICQYFLKTPIPKNIFHSKSKQYSKLWNRLVDEHNGFLKPQVDKISRLVTELLSDDLPIFKSLTKRVFTQN